jgi:uncharacterized protein (TIGR02452 family)
MHIDRKRAAALGREAVEILEAGRYRADDGTTVEIASLLSQAVAGTSSYPPDWQRPALAPRGTATRLEVVNETTLAAARRLTEQGSRPVALNFASAKNPGGGFLSGARAQEESLARASGLYACLNGHAMYAFHRARKDAMYTDYAIYSPDVPVFRTDSGKLLARPYLCSFITSPAVNAKVVLERAPSRRLEIRDAMAQRIDKVLTIAALHDHQSMILGAWGCGAFGNDCGEVAGLFRDVLRSSFRDVFATIIFAITDWSVDRRFIGPFEQALCGT